ncbi:type II CRISPR RNA-guided endonuclease Cas9 [Clostridiaceae bacterium DONG20-135]|uniref:CRISPR-associated endonuclease Cas9 n=1 Tax=Copranaerobaculum intestinale TaxID=2692629 RepID=A0A6N8U455_9FIRM|nr:type II CRISPR RNA-guided endonuclease Cas9 [Copranaerobaculum intestinale]MXQ72956.1 type II CRISPR RNA-guided endonuclease Cas9 [Copranaerobaculum intestinale]
MKKENYIMGLDLGVGSVGWSCMAVNDNHEPCRLIAANSRIFPSKNGSMEERRNARGLRRLIRRKKARIKKVKNLFVEYDFFTKEQINEFFDFEAKNYENPYRLKCRGLTSALTKEELLICLVHYAKYRGFRSNRKNKEVAKDTKSASEEQKLLYSIEQTQTFLDENNCTISQYILSDPKFKDKIKNTSGNFKIGVTRKMITDEAEQVLDTQITCGLIDDSFKKSYLDILTYQRSFSEGPESGPYSNPIVHMIGTCSFDKQLRAPIAAPTYEVFILLQKLTNIYYYKDSYRDKKQLSVEQIQAIVEKAKKTKEIKYKHVMEIIGEDVHFTGLTLSRKDYAEINKKGKKHPERNLDDLRKKQKLETSICKMEITSYFKNAFKKVHRIDDLKLLDEIADLLSKYKTDKEIEKYLDHDDYPLLRQQDEDIKGVVKGLDEGKFIRFGKLSFHVLYEIVPLMLEKGYMYSDAMREAGFDHVNKKSDDKVHDQLPSVSDIFDDLDMSVTNRCVRTTLQETKNLINALIRKYGKPEEIHVEVARELTKDENERAKIMDSQISNKVEKINLKRQILSKFDCFYSEDQIKHNDLLKYKLFIEQKGIDPYMLAYTNDENVSKIHEKDIFDNDAYEIDHILPYSMCFNDLYSNKVLVSTKMNREKGNRIPYEAFHARPGFLKFQSWVYKNIHDARKRENYLTKKVTEEMLEEFSARALNDTRYATKVLCKIISYYFSDVKVRSFTGQVTSKLKGIWHLNTLTHSYQSGDLLRHDKRDEKLDQLYKRMDDEMDIIKQKEIKSKIISMEKDIEKKDRSNHLHHALDATIIACATDTLRRRIEMHEMYIRQRTLNIQRYRIPVIEEKTGELKEYRYEEKATQDLSDYFDITKNMNYRQFPVPYANFVEEIKLRIYERDEEVLRKSLCTFPNYTKEQIEKVKPLMISHKIIKKQNSRLHEATIMGVRKNPENQQEIVLTKRISIDKDSFKLDSVEKIYDSKGTQKAIYDAVKVWLAGYDNGSKAYTAHQGYPIAPNGHEIKKVKINLEDVKERICIHPEKKQYVDKDDVIQVYVYKRKDDDRLYFAGMDQYRLMNLDKNPMIMLWYGQDKNFKYVLYNDLEKEGYIPYLKLNRNQLIRITLQSGVEGICLAGGTSSGMFEVYSILGDGLDLLASGIQRQVKTRYQITVSTIKDIQILHSNILGEIF